MFTAWKVYFPVFSVRLYEQEILLFFCNNGKTHLLPPFKLTFQWRLKRHLFSIKVYWEFEIIDVSAIRLFLDQFFHVVKRRFGG